MAFNEDTHSQPEPRPVEPLISRDTLDTEVSGARRRRESHRRAACTIVSWNYLQYAKVLAQSFKRYHPEYEFHVLLVDRAPNGLDLSSQIFKMTTVEELSIPHFESVAFRFGILELNTNVKPTFLKYLLNSGIDQVLYLDPDISVYASLEPIFDLLDQFGALLTPHCLSANSEAPYAEVLLLVNGVYNLGFIGVSASGESREFLDWWEYRCLNLGYDERWSGLFVDQKWINLAPCYFKSVHILRDPGCNVAYWNLHERRLTRDGERWIVNDDAPLSFFHFSGIAVDGGNRISRHTEQFDLTSRQDLVELFAEYRDRLAMANQPAYPDYRYAYGYFSNGKLINKLQRAAYAANLDRFQGSDPFDANGPFYHWSSRKGLQSQQECVGLLGRKAYNPNDPRIRIVNGILRTALRVLKADRYSLLMRYLEFASVLRNQRDILG